MAWRSRARSRTRAAALLGAGLAALGLAAGGGARPGAPAPAPSVPFATLAGSCDPAAGDAVLALPRAAAAHAAYLVRLAATAGPLAVTGATPAGTPLAAAAADTVWRFAATAYQAGATVRVRCQAPASFALAFLPVPAGAALFSGATGAAQPGAPASTVAFSVPHAAPYAARLTVTQGSVGLRLDGRPLPAAPGGRLALGTLAAGRDVVAVVAGPGPQARWTLAVAPLPVTLGPPALAHPFLTPGTAATVTYAVDGETALSADVTTAAGREVRRLARSAPVGAGTHTVVWDGRDGGGAAAPDGRYALVLRSLDPAGNASTRTLALLVDRHGPAGTLAARPDARFRGLALTAADPASGLATTVLAVDGRRVGGLPATGGRLTYLPAGGWPAGRHAYAADLADRAGNHTRLAGTFTVPTATPLPPPPVRVTMISDSVGAALLEVPSARAALGQGVDLHLDLAVCRRLVAASCPFQGHAPPNTLATVQALGRSLGQVLVVFVGYNDDPGGYGTGIDEVVRAALAAGVRHVVWVTLGEPRPYLHTINVEIRAAARRWPQLSVADWAAFSRGRPWFGTDGLHLSPAGASALAAFLHAPLAVLRGELATGLGPLPAAAPALPPVLTVAGSRLGPFALGSTTAQALAAFGAPATGTAAGQGCTLAWPPLGLTLTFTLPRSGLPCRDGVAVGAELAGSRFRTARGLVAGAPAATAAHLYPGAAAGAGGLLQLEGATTCGDPAGAPYPALAARVTGGRVTALVLAFTPCG